MKAHSKEFLVEKMARWGQITTCRFYEYLDRGPSQR